MFNNGNMTAPQKPKHASPTLVDGIHMKSFFLEDLSVISGSSHHTDKCSNAYFSIVCFSWLVEWLYWADLFCLLPGLKIHKKKKEMPKARVAKSVLQFYSSSIDRKQNPSDDRTERGFNLETPWMPLKWKLKEHCCLTLLSLCWRPAFLSVHTDFYGCHGRM